MGNSHLSIEAPVGVFDLHLALKEPSELERAEVDVPHTVVDLFEPYVFANAGRGDIDPRLVPANAALGADIAHFEPIGIFDWRQLARHGEALNEPTPGLRGPERGHWWRTAHRYRFGCTGGSPYS